MTAMIDGGEIKCLKQKRERVLLRHCQSGLSTTDVSESKDEDDIERTQDSVQLVFICCYPSFSCL